MPVVHAILFLFHIGQWIGNSYKNKWPERHLDDTSAQMLGCFTAIAFLIPVGLFISGITWTVEIIGLLMVKFSFFLLCKGIFSSVLVIFSALLFIVGVSLVNNYGKITDDDKAIPVIVSEKRKAMDKKRMYCTCGEHIKPGQNFCITCGISLK